MQVSFDLLPGIWCVVDTSSRYLYYNQAYAELVGIADKPAGFLLGKTVADMHCEAADCAALFWEEDALVKRLKRPVRVLNIIKMANDTWTILQIDKQPILNAAGEVEAIIFHLIDQSANHQVDLALQLSKKIEKQKITKDMVSIKLERKTQKIDLKRKESECLFYLIRGFSYKEIAVIQSVSYRTIVDHVERLKSKFDVHSTSELISCAMAAGYPSSLPQDYFNKQISIILTD